MLDVKYILRGKGSISLLVNEHLLHESSFAASVYSTPLAKDPQQTSDGDLRLSMTELSTALSVGTVSFPSLAEKLKVRGTSGGVGNKLCHSPSAATADLLLYSDPLTGSHSVYILSSGENVGTIKRPGIVSDKTRFSCATACSVSGGKEREGLFFCLCEDDSLYAIIAQPHVAGSQTQQANTQRVRMSPTFRLDPHKFIAASVSGVGKAAAQQAKLPPLAKIQSLHCHPTLPLLFSLHNDGAVYVSIIHFC
jgi:hypothetical protein